MYVHIMDLWELWLEIIDATFWVSGVPCPKHKKAFLWDHMEGSIRGGIGRKMFNFWCFFKYKSFYCNYLLTVCLRHGNMDKIECASDSWNFQEVDNK